MRCLTAGSAAVVLIAMPVHLSAKGPAPALGKTLIATPVAKGALVKLPGAGQFVPLGTVTSIPVGTIIDAGKGRVRITAATDKRGHTQSSVFYGGTFRALQPSGPTTELRLLGSLRTCSRHLWGNGKGSFRTRGRYASATVRGTVWLQKDTCSTTTTVVKRGTVVVNDFVRHTRVQVEAGHRYVARAGKH